MAQQGETLSLVLGAKRLRSARREATDVTRKVRTFHLSRGQRTPEFRKKRDVFENTAEVKMR